MFFRRRAPHLRKVIKREGLKLSRKEYKSMIEKGDILVNGRKVEHNTRLPMGVYIIDVYAGKAHLKLWVETWGDKHRAYNM
jgi:RNA-binding protein YlmH